MTFRKRAPSGGPGGIAATSLPRCARYGLAGLPALAVPAGFNAAGLPMGLQIAGPNQGELASASLLGPDQIKTFLRAIVEQYRITKPK